MVFISEEKISLSKLKEVKGIGNKTIKRIKDKLKTEKEWKQKRNTQLKIDKLQTNVIHCGDHIKIMREHIPDNSVDLTVTSPPYDNLRVYEGYQFDFKPLAQELYRITQDSGVVVWVVADETANFCESLSSFKQAIYFVKDIGFKLLDTMIYKKKGGPSPYPNMMRYAPWFEYMFILTKGKPQTFNPIKDVPTRSGAGQVNSGNTTRQKNGETINTGSYITSQYKMRCNVWEYDVGHNKDTADDIALDHPARFPEKLAADHIKSWSNEGDIILDPMCGSGTTLKMAEKLNRKWVGIDCSEKYCEISKKRIKQINN